MTTATASDPAEDAACALRLFMQQPLGFGGIVLRGAGPVRDALIDAARMLLVARMPVRRMPATIDQDRLLGGLDLTATLATGQRIRAPGLLDEVRGGVLIIPMAERLPDATAAQIAATMDAGHCAAIMLDDGSEPDEAPPARLLERCAFQCDLSRARTVHILDEPIAQALSVATLSDAQRMRIAATAAALGIGSLRALILAERCAAAHAAMHGRPDASDADVAAAVRLVLAPRATCWPISDADQEPVPPAEQPGDKGPQDDNGADRKSRTDDPLPDDILLAAAAAAIPAHILDQLSSRASRGRVQSGRAGERSKSAMRGRPLGSRPGMPGHGKRLALLPTLMAAAPWQRVRRKGAAPDAARLLDIRRDDLRIRHYEERRETLTIFVVDASGSAALARLAEAKGAIELMLAQAYVKRAQVALIAFRHSGAELLLPPTRSLTRARRALSILPGGGGTPLAAGLMAARGLADAAIKRGQTPTIAILTDGKANMRIDGTAGRAEAISESEQVARQIAAAGLRSIVIDISPRPREEAAGLATALAARYVPLPQAQSAAMVRAIEAVGQAAGEPTRP